MLLIVKRVVSYHYESNELMHSSASCTVSSKPLAVTLKLRIL